MGRGRWKGHASEVQPGPKEYGAERPYRFQNDETRRGNDFIMAGSVSVTL